MVIDMVKVVIGKPWDELWDETMHDIEHRIPQKEDFILYIDSVEAALKFLTPQRIKMLRVVNKLKPASLYALAKFMKKDIKTIATDAKILNNAGLLKLVHYKEGKRVKVRPRFPSKKITIELAI